MSQSKIYVHNHGYLDNNLIDQDIDLILKKLKDLDIKSRDVVLCESSSPYGVFCQYIASLKYGYIPFFYNYSLTDKTSILIEDKIKKLLGVKASLKLNHDYKFEVKPITNSCEKMYSFNEGDVLFLTSATSGFPKIVLRTKKNLDSEVNRYSNFLKMSENDVILPTIPINNSFGLGSCIINAIKNNSVIVDTGSAIPRVILQCSIKSKSTIILGTVFSFNKFVEISDRYKLYDKTRFCISTGCPMSMNLQNVFFDIFNVPLIQQYGSTETGSLSVSEPGDPYQVVGKPLNGVIFSIKPEKPVIYVSTPGTIGSYISENGIVDLPKNDFETNDVGEISEDGKLHILGRKDDLINIQGFKIPTKFVNSIIKQFPGIKESEICVDNSLEIKKIFCQYTSDENIKEESIIDFCSKKLPIYQVPKRFIRVEKIKSVSKKSWKSS